MPCLLKMIPVMLLIFYTVDGYDLMVNYTDMMEQRLQMVVNIISYNWKNNGRTHILAVGNFSDSFFTQMPLESNTWSVTDFMKNHYDIKHTMPYYSNTIVLNCLDFEQFELAMTNAVNSPFWHPLSNVILYYHSLEEKIVLAKIFFIFWYYRAINVIIIQYKDSEELLLVSEYNPFTCDYVKTQNRFGCWTTQKIDLPIGSFKKSFSCEGGCDSVSLESKRRYYNLGSCLGFDTYQISYANKSLIQKLKLFKDKGKNLRGCALRGFAIEVLPFLEIREYDNQSFTLHARDGKLWNTMAERMNFTIDFSIGKKYIKQQFHFDINVQQVFAFIQRKADLVVYPLYQFDLMIAEVDNTIAYKESGVCIVSQRAAFDTIIFDANLLHKNAYYFIQFIICFFCTWFVFFIFNVEQYGRFSFDQAGKDLMNTFRTMLSITSSNPPKRASFRLFLTIAIWSFFVINFSTQAAIISIFSVYKRGKEVDTMEDVFEKGYPIEGMASPDLILPEDEEIFRMIESRRVPVQDIFGCINAMTNSSRRFCTIDCAVGRYLERNRINSKGEQYLHVASHARLHSHYLNMILHRHSPLTATFNRIALALVEAGLIKKWEEYRFNDIKEEAPIKALTMADVIGIFKFLGIFTGICLFTFFVEVALHVYVSIKTHGVVILRKWIVLLVKKIRKEKKKQKNSIDTIT